MKIVLKSIGDLRDVFGKEPQEMELPDGANAGHLLAGIEERFGKRIPAYMWDYESHKFRGPIVLLIDKKVVQNDRTPLRDGLEVTIMKALMGG